MAENIAESQAAKDALTNQQAPAGLLDPSAPLPGDGEEGGDDLDELQGSEGDQEEAQTYAGAVKTTWILELTLYREDKANDFVVNYKEIAELVFKRLGVERGMLHSVDTSPYKKIVLELDNMCAEGNLNITQALQVRHGLWTRPIQAPEKDRLVYIKWEPMKMARICRQQRGSAG